MWFIEVSELEGQTRDLAELLYNAERPTVNEVVQMAIVLIFVEIESLKDIVSEKFETDLPWAKVAARRHKKSTCIDQRVTHPVSAISNCYSLLRYNTNIHSFNTRNKSSLHPPLLRLTKSQKGVYYAGIMIYNCLPLKIKELSGKVKYCKRSLKKFLSHGSFYTMEEYLDWTSIRDLNTMYS